MAKPSSGEIKNAGEQKLIKKVVGRRLTGTKKKALAKRVKEHLAENGKFYRVREIEDFYFFFQPEKKLYLIGSLEFRGLCNELYTFNGTQNLWKYIEEELIVYALREGELTDIYRFACYRGGNLYIQSRASSLFRLNGEKIEELDNGTDGVLFKNNLLDPIRPNYEYEGSPVEEKLVRVPNISEDKKNRYDLYRIFIYSIFFESLLPTKPVVLFTGPKRSGKTSAGRALKCALFGQNENVDTGVTQKEDAFWASVCNSYFLCIDNVDSLVKWLADAIAVVATGGKFKRRQLYETNEMAEYTPRCFLMLTSRNPNSFKRDDVVDRLLLIEVEGRVEFIEEGVLLENLKKGRGEIWGELLTYLNKIVSALKMDKPKEALPFRLADWARLALIIGPILGIQNVEAKIREMEHDKSDFALEDDAVCIGLELWLERQIEPDWIASGELYSQIIKIYSGKGMEYPIKNPKTFGSILKNLLPELETRFEIQYEKRGGNKKFYLIQRRKDTEEETTAHAKNSIDRWEEM